jgi:hypothetical protein
MKLPDHLLRTSPDFLDEIPIKKLGEVVLARFRSAVSNLRPIHHFTILSRPGPFLSAVLFLIYLGKNGELALLLWGVFRSTDQ